jgi:crossover junction endodeoxyribonuclease RuvC
MRVLGVDPGTVNFGYGIIAEDDGAVQMVDSGAIKVSARLPLETRLCKLYSELNQIILRHKPDEVAVEEPFVGRNARTAFALGKCEAIVVLAAASRGLPIYYYSPAIVKQQITNYGQSDKQQMQKMIEIYLGLRTRVHCTHAVDALAVAICHLRQSQYERRVSRHLST